MNLRESPIRSSKYLNGAKGSACTFMGPTCNGDLETTVFAHLNGAAFGKGKGQKAHDIAGFDACFCCHGYVDTGHGTKPLISVAEFNWHLLRAVVLTMVNRVRRGIVVVPQDVERTVAERPVKPRLPREQRAKVGKSRPIQNNPNRKIQSRSFLRKKEAMT